MYVYTYIYTHTYTQIIYPPIFLTHECIQVHNDSTYTLRGQNEITHIKKNRHFKWRLYPLEEAAHLHTPNKTKKRQPAFRTVVSLQSIYTKQLGPLDCIFGFIMPNRIYTHTSQICCILWMIIDSHCAHSISHQRHSCVGFFSMLVLCFLLFCSWFFQFLPLTAKFENCYASAIRTHYNVKKSDGEGNIQEIV